MTVGSCGPIDSSTALVGEAPGDHEVMRGVPFIGPTGEVVFGSEKKHFVGFMERAGLPPRAEVFIANAMNCRPPVGTPESKLNLGVMACHDRLMAELEAYPRRLILSLGNSALKGITGRKSAKITQEHGRPIAWHGGEGVIVPTIHPAALLKAGANLAFTNMLKMDFKYASELYSGMALRDPGTPSYSLIETRKDLRRILPFIIKQDLLAVDIETGGGKSAQLDPRRGQLLCLAITWTKNKAIVITGDCVRANKDLVGELLNAPHPRYLYHNGKFDTAFLWQLGIPCRVDDDAMLLHYSLQERGLHDLETLCEIFIGSEDYKKILDQYLDPKTNPNKDYGLIPPEVLYKYNAYDTDYTWQLFNILYPKLEHLAGPKRAYYEILIPASEFLRKVEARGVPISLPDLNIFQARLEDDVARTHKQATELAIEFGWDNIKYARESKAKKIPKVFNPGSWQQVQWLLYTHLHLHEGITFKDDKWSTADDVLKRLPRRPITDAIMEHRRSKRTLTTNGVGIRLRMDPVDRVHSSFMLHIVATGRLSSRNPNLQNLPADPEIRRIVMAPPGFVLAEADYGQAEIRMLAILSRDPFLMKCYIEGRDLHNEVAAQLFGPDYTVMQRRFAKVVNFGIAYGLAAESLVLYCETEGITGIDVKIAQETIDAWFRRMPKAKAFLDRCRQLVIEGKGLQSPFGRIMRFGFVSSKSLHHFQNEATNFPIQSTASDLTLISAMELDSILEFQYNSLIINLVHDSILLQIPEDPILIDKVIKLVTAKMEAVPILKLKSPIHFAVDAKLGYHWGNKPNMLDYDLNRGPEQVSQILQAVAA